MNIRETIVVEGKDDESAVLKAVNANIICTHGFGIRPEVLDVIRKAYETCGIIIFTDPDHAGETIRTRLTKLFPDAKQAFLTKDQALKDDDIGIENACPEDILKAFECAKAVSSSAETLFTMSDMVELGLSGCEDSSRRRDAVGAKLGIGSANVKTFLRRLNFMGITREDFIKACESVDDSNN